jgi:hypothetical protein
MWHFRFVLVSLLVVCRPYFVVAEPVADTPFLQEVATKLSPGNGYPDAPAESLVVDEVGRPWVLVDGNIVAYEKGGWRNVEALRDLGRVQKLVRRVDHPGFILAAEGKIFAVRSGEKPRELATLPFREPPTCLAAREQTVWFGTASGLYEVSKQSAQEISIPGSSGQSITALGVGLDGTLAVGTNRAFFWRKGDTWRHVFAPGLIDGPVTASLVATDGSIWVGTASALHVLRPDGAWKRFGGREGLPYGDITCMAEGLNGDIWVGTKHGAFRKCGRRWDVYAGLRWLPNDEACDLGVGRDGTAWIGTASGVTQVAFREFTLESKADHYEAMIRPRHDRHGLVAGCNLSRTGDLSSWVHRDEDNDGLWTSIYLASQCFRYAVTGHESAKANAIRSFRAMERLETITPIPGFFARSYVHKSELRPTGGEWHWTEDHEWLWKGDTSSDEAVGHFFVYGIYYDLIDDPAEKERCAALIRRIIDHIVRSGYYLVDLDGKPTRWGVWAPEKLNNDPTWVIETGLNSLQILSFLRVAHHVTGDSQYLDESQRLIREFGYAGNMLNQKVETPWEVNHSDDELAFLPYYSLLLYEDVPTLRGIYLRSLERSWQIEIPEQSALWNIIYGAVSGKECRIQEAVETLRDWPLDLIDWQVDNAHRLDVLIDRDLSRFGGTQLLQVLPPDERPLMRWNGNPYSPSGGGRGTSEHDGSAYLLPYWMSRYHKLLNAPGK